MNKEIVIIGAGPGGYEAAMEGARLGHKITLIDDYGVGGTCLHWGCIPTKTFYKQSKLLYDMNRAQSHGLSYGAIELNHVELLKRKQEIVTVLENGIMRTLKSLGVNIIEGRGYIDGKTVIVKGTNKPVVLEPEVIVLAMGSKPKLLPIEGCKLEGVLDSKGLLALTEIPKSLTIVGAGVIGLEFASIFNQSGTKVTVVEYLDRILPTQDLAVAKRLMSYMKQQGITLITGAKAQCITKEQGALNLNYSLVKNSHSSNDNHGLDSNVNVLKSDYILVAVGRTGNITAFEPATSDIEVANNFVVVNEHLETSVKNIFAIGDINGMNMLAHGASYQGKWLMKYISGLENQISHLMPAAVFTIPEIASVGFTEEQLKEKGIPYNSNKTMFGTLGKAHAMNETEGFIKILTDYEDTLLGVHIIGADASNLIQEAVLAMSSHMPLKVLQSIIHTHPTLSEIYL
ncbi:MAG: dihydrolipoyl dehydrogenase [Vallitaleaceae bacterium]|jgi:dihydrolipoamide dehydrogenase|nr:dihydrolipoyl dehydrogenase [Vallitaleaceae bacterium]